MRVLRRAVMMYAKCKMALNNDLIDKVLFVQNEQKMSEIRLTSQFHMMFDWLVLKQKKTFANSVYVHTCSV